MNKKILALLAVVIVLVLGAYALISMRSNNRPADNSADTNVSTNELQTINAVINGPVGTADSEDGKYVVSKEGLSLYVNLNDQGETANIVPTCDAACEKTWIPYIADQAKHGSISGSNDPLLSKINIFTRPDGRPQYALGTQPLYLYAGDLRPGDISGTSRADWMVARP